MRRGTSQNGEGSSFRRGQASDAELIRKVRNGESEAFDRLYARHHQVALNVALGHADNSGDAEDTVADAFAAVLESLQAGKGPDEFFRAYLLTTVTRMAHRTNRAASRVRPTDSDLDIDQAVLDPDPALQAFEATTVARAFGALPERWQTVLWYLDVELQKPAAVAPLLGLSPNAVSALALRAREGLRRNYLQNHIEVQDDACRPYMERLGGYAVNSLSARDKAQVQDHLDQCLSCQALLLELTELRSSMRVVLIPLVTGLSASFLAGTGAWALPAASGGVLAHGVWFPGKAGANGTPHTAAMSIAAASAAVLVAGGIAAAAMWGGTAGTPAALPPALAEAAAAGETPSAPTSTPASTPAATATEAQALAVEVPPSATVPGPAPAAAVPGSVRPMVPPAPVAAAQAEPAVLQFLTVPTPPVVPLPAFSPLPAPVPAPSVTALPVPVPTPAPTQAPMEPPGAPVIPTPMPTPTPPEPPSVPPVTQRPIFGQPSVSTVGDRSVVTMDFTVAEGRTFSTARIVFLAEEVNGLNPKGMSAPDGWDCAMGGTTAGTMTCSSKSPVSGKFSFSVTVSLTNNASNPGLSAIFTAEGADAYPVRVAL